MAMAKCEGCGEERDVDGQMYDFGPTIACGQCWLSLLRFIRVGTPPTEKPDYWKRQYAMAVERAVEAEKARDALETELEHYRAALVEREREGIECRAKIERLKAEVEHFAMLHGPSGFERMLGKGRK